jgi:ribonucleoside-diphosphate reductase alpha chain
VAKALASSEKDKDHWFKEFYTTMINGATPAGRILSNAGAGEHKPKTSLINCTVSNIVEDSMEGIMRAATNSAITLASGAGIGYEFSTLRPKGAFVRGAGSYTSGPLTFMDIFDTMCFTVSSAGGRRGAQMGTMAVWHPDIESFIKAKREDGRFRQFNLSLLIDDEFIAAVKNDLEWDLFFPVMKNERCSTSKFVRKSIFWDKDYCERMGYWIEDDKLVCKVYNTIKAKELWETIMMSTYNFAEPGFLLIDNINKYNNNYFCENIRATNPCGEQPLPPDGSCLLGSINLVHFVSFPFKENATFDFAAFKENVRTFCRMLDNVVEMNGLPLT